MLRTATPRLVGRSFAFLAHGSKKDWTWSVGMMYGERLPGVHPARYLCIKYLISSPKFVLTLGKPLSRPH